MNWEISITNLSDEGCDADVIDHLDTPDSGEAVAKFSEHLIVDNQIDPMDDFEDRFDNILIQVWFGPVSVAYKGTGELFDCKDPYIRKTFPLISKDKVGELFKVLKLRRAWFEANR